MTVVHARHDLAVRIPQALIHEAVLLWWPQQCWVRARAALYWCMHLLPASNLVAGALIIELLPLLVAFIEQLEWFELVRDCAWGRSAYTALLVHTLLHDLILLQQMLVHLVSSLLLFALTNCSFDLLIHMLLQIFLRHLSNAGTALKDLCLAFPSLLLYFHFLDLNLLLIQYLNAAEANSCFLLVLTWMVIEIWLVSGSLLAIIVFITCIYTRIWCLLYAFYDI